MRRLLILLLPVLLAGCAGPVVSPPAEPVPGPSLPEPMSTGGILGPDDIAVPETVASGTFSVKGTTAITYDPRIVPAGATAQVTIGRAAEGVSVRRAVTGMLPRRTYGAHLHTKPCAADPAAAGPHYQHEPVPMPSRSSAPSSAAPSPDPSYVNPDNEVWLDFTADRMGAATTTAVQEWAFDELTPPRSVIVHLTRTRTEPGMAGTAGRRVACLTLPG